MTVALIPDGPAAASHLAMLANLTAPFGGGAVDDAVPVDAAGLAVVTRTARHPLLLAAPAADLGTSGLRIRAVLDPAGAASPLGTLEFAPWTEAGAFLPLHRPAADPDTGTAAPFTVGLTAVTVAPDGTETAADVAGLIQVRLLEGTLGSLLYALGAEKQRLRRTGREITAMRRLALARDDALDRTATDLGLTRFTDQLVVHDGNIETEPRREPDDELRRRLRLYRPLLVPTRARLLELLNGPGAASDPNAGPLGELGLTDRFDVVEGDEPVPIAVHLIAGDAVSTRDNFLSWLRDSLLIWPQNTPQGNTAHAGRFLPATTRDRITDLRRDLRDTLAFGGDATTNPALAQFVGEALVRVGRCRKALGVTAPMTLLRAQQPDVGSRYQLGLGVDLAVPPAAELTALAAALADPGRTPAPDPETESLLRSLVPVPAADDPVGRWLLEPCGLRTVHRVDAGTVYVSHLPNAGLVITGPDATLPPAAGPVGEPIFLQARHQAPGDPGANSALQAGLDGAAAAWATRGGSPWTVVADADAPARWAQARTLEVDPPEPVGVALAGAGLRALADPASAVAALGTIPGELMQTLELDPALSAALGAGDPDASNQLLALVDLFAQQQLTSVLPLVTAAGPILLVVGVVGLPGAGLNLDERRAVGFRWYVVPIVPASGDPVGVVRSATSRGTYTPLRAGLAAVVVLGSTRTGAGGDPYQFRVELPAGSVLGLGQYEFLMNLLDSAFPAGIEVNTFALRREHVDLDGDGVADPLPPTASRTFRRFRQTRTAR